MQKVKNYSDTRFDFGVLQEAITAVREILGRADQTSTFRQLTIACPDSSSWAYENFEEFLVDYRNNGDRRDPLSRRSRSRTRIALAVVFVAQEKKTQITMRSPCRAEIERVFELFEKHAERSKLPPDPVVQEAKVRPSVIIGHGASLAWQDLKSLLHDKLGVKIESYETGDRSGQRVRDILEGLPWKHALDIVVLTREDAPSDNSSSLRQNAVHEASLLQGKLGFARALLMLEDGVKEFSHVQGVHSIRFSKGNIRDTFDEVLSILDREFPFEFGNTHWTAR